MGTDVSLGDALFGSTKQAVLGLFFRHPEGRFYLRQVIQMVGRGSGAVQREIRCLAECGIVTERVEGRQKYYQANAECPIYPELKSLITKTSGIADALKAALTPLHGNVDVVFIYGSIASGQETARSDIDLMVVGRKVLLDDIVSAVANVERSVGREINPSVYLTEEFRRKVAGGHYFLRNVIAGPKIFIVGDEHELTRLAQVRVVKGARTERTGDRRSARRGGA